MKLNRFQQTVVDARASSPQVVEACPGSGKTSTVVPLVLAVLEDGADPTRVLVVTFSNKASGESRRKTAQALFPSATDEELAYLETMDRAPLKRAKGWTDADVTQWVAEDPRRQMVAERFSTIHALSLRTLKELGYKFTVLAPGGSNGKNLYWEAQALVKDGLKELDWDQSPRAVEWWFGAAINSLVEPHDAEQWFADRLAERGGPVWDAPKLAELYRRYRDFCKRHSAVDFNMMQAMLVKLIRTSPRVRERVAGLFDVIVVDEAQDTDPIQCEILWTMASNHGRIVFVGDVDQSMYRFRGAEPEVLRSRFEAHWPKVERFNLPVNYRSTRAIIRTSAGLIGDNYGGDLDRYLKPFEARPDAPEGDPVDYEETQDFSELAQAVAERVAENPDNWFVLSRTRAECAAIHTELIRLAVPAINKSGGLLFGAPHVRKVLAYARLACNYKDARDDLEILSEVANVASVDFRAPMNRRRHLEGCNETRPWVSCGCPLVYEEGVDSAAVRFYGRRSVEKAGGTWRGIVRQQDEQNRGGYPTVAAKGARDLVRFVGSLERLAGDSRACLNAIIEGSVLNWLKHDRGLDDEDLAENGLAEDFDLLINLTEPDETVEQYLARVDGLAAGGVEGDEAESVLVGTVHWSKGAERPGVVVNTTRLPIVPPSPKSGQLPTTPPPLPEEERRLLFVAITRAQNECHLVGSLEWNNQETERSYFVQDLIDRGLVEFEDEEPEDSALLSPEPTPYFTDSPAFTDGPFDVTDEAFERAERNFRDPVHDLTPPPPGSNTWECRTCGQSWESSGVPYQGNIGTCPGPVPRIPDDWTADAARKAEFARHEAEQEARAFLSDPDYQESCPDLDNLFPDAGRFEDNIYRPSAQDFVRAMPNFTPRLDRNQLVMEREIAPGHVVKVYTSVHVGEIAQGTGEDSIRVVREDAGRNGRTFHFKNAQDWVTRQVPKDADTPEKAAAHLAAKVQAQVDAFTRKCPECGALQVKCRAGKGKAARFWWKGTGNCRCKVEGGW